jgi:hypothetical protein
MLTGALVTIAGFVPVGGLVVATLLTLVFLPALYVAWFRIAPQVACDPAAAATAAAVAA